MVDCGIFGVPELLALDTSDGTRENIIVCRVLSAADAIPVLGVMAIVTAALGILALAHRLLRPPRPYHELYGPDLA